MLLLLAERWNAVWPGLAGGAGLERTTSRAALAAVATFLIALVSGPLVIRWLRRRFREPVKTASADLARLHAAKNDTPTMGGVFIVCGIIAAMTVCGDWSNPYLPVAMLLTVALGAVGVYDDLVKLSTERRGMSARGKLAAQCAIAFVVAVLVYRLHATVDRGLELTLPVAGTVELGWLFVPLATLVIVASSNAVNLADGLDGLAGGCLVCACGALAVVAYAAGHAEWARYLGVPHIAGAGEMTVVAAALVGGLLAFLWFNCHPASVFMGDAGSLPLGGLLGLLAVVCRQEMLLVVIGGVFVVEAASVIVQVGWFRYSGRRIFRCAPLHHHFQLRGWPEDKIVVRFWIAGGLCAILGLAGLRMHGGEVRPALQVADESPTPAVTAPGQEPDAIAELFR